MIKAKFLKKTIKFAIDSLFPIECLKCGREGAWVCDKCLLGIPMKTDFPCVVCGRPTIFGKTHKECLTKTAIDGALCATSYEEGFIKQLIRIYKYKYVLDLGRYLGWVMARFIKQLQNKILPSSVIDEGMKMKQLIMMRMMPSFLHKNTKTPQNTKTLLTFKANEPILVPIPLHRRRLRERGFNQAEILAREFGKYFNWPVATNALARRKYTTAQMTLKSEARVENIKNAFECVGDNDAIKGKVIILIDDVLTTGATAGEAALTLKSAGAKGVWVMCLAKD